MKLYTVEQVNLIDWESWDIAPLGGELAEDIISIINRSCHYITNHWWRYRKYNKLNQQIYITFASAAEKVVLPNAYAARLLATAVKFNILDPSVAKHNYQKTQDKAVKLLRSLCHGYIVNMANGWRSITVMAQTSYTGMLLWDKLNTRDKMLFVNMLEHCAGELLDIKPTFNYNDGKSDNSGANTNQVANNAERAMVLTIASLMLPNHEKAAKWAVKAKLFLKTALSISDGKAKGSNYTDEAIIVNKNYVDAEQMSNITLALDTFSASLLLNGQAYRDIIDNATEVYSAFNNLYLSRNRKAWEPLYCVDGDGAPTAVINVPFKPDKTNLMPYLAMDIFSYSCALDTKCERKAREWAEPKIQHIIYKQKSSRNGRYFRSANNRDREAKLGFEATMSYVMMYLKAIGTI